jgi:diaminopimelate epimerase
VTIDVASSPIRVPLTIEWRDDDHVIMTGPAEWEWSGAVDPQNGTWQRDEASETSSSEASVK